MCAYFLGKGTNVGFDWGRRGRPAPGTMDTDVFNLMPGMPGGGGAGVPDLNVPGFTPSSPIAGPTPQPSLFQTPVMPEAGQPQEPGGYDALMDMMFGKGFETVRGIGERGRESTYDMLAREGLLGTGAAKGAAQDIAWQTERGITDLIRNMAQMRSQEEKEAMNLMLTYMSMLQQGWRS